MLISNFWLMIFHDELFVVLCLGHGHGDGSGCVPPRCNRREGHVFLAPNCCGRLFVIGFSVVFGDYRGISPWFLPCFSLSWDEKPRTSDLAGTTMSFELFRAPDGKPQVGIPHLQWGSWGKFHGDTMRIYMDIKLYSNYLYLLYISLLSLSLKQLEVIQ